MNTVKLRKVLFKIGWIVLSACVAAFFVIALFVYTMAEPSGVFELLSHDESWYSASELSEMSGDLEAFPYVTKVYEYATDNDGVDICWINDDGVWRDKIPYGVVVGQSAEHNYFVECFVYSDIADKQLVKRTWGVSVAESDGLTLTESKAPYLNKYYNETGDIKKGSYNKANDEKSQYYTTFIRITVKPGFGDVDVEVKGRTQEGIYYI